MPRVFVSTSSQYLHVASPISGYTFGVSFWFKVAALPSGDQVMFSIGSLSLSANFCAVVITSAGAIQMQRRTGGSTDVVTAATTASVNTWYQVVLASVSSSSITIYVSNDAGALGTVTHAFNQTDMTVGRNARSVTPAYFDGRIYGLALYPAYTPTAADVSSLYTGYGAALSGSHPLDVSDGHYLPLYNTGLGSMVRTSSALTAITLTDNGGSTADTASLPSSAPHLLTWSASDGTILTTGRKISRVQASGGGITPVVTMDPFGRSALYCDADDAIGEAAHSEFVVVIPDGVDFRELPLYFAADFTQRITGTLVDDSAVDADFATRFCLIESGAGQNTIYNARTKWDGATFTFSSEAVQGGVSAYNVGITNVYGSDGTTRVRFMVSYDGTTFRTYYEDEDGDYVLLDENAKTQPNIRWFTLRARNGIDPPGGDPHHECWFSNIALGVDIDEVWDAQDNIAAGTGVNTYSGSAVLAALRAYLLDTDSTLYDLVADRIRYAYADREETQPFLVWQMISGVPFETMDANGYDLRVQFTAYAHLDAGPDSALDVIDALRERLHRQRFLVAGHDTMTVVMDQPRGPMREDEGWRVDVDAFVRGFASTE